MAVFGKTALINNLIIAVRKGLKPHNMRDMVDTLWRDLSDKPSIINQPTHGFAVNDAIRHNGTKYVKARAIDSENSNTVGVVYAVYDADNFSYKNEGTIESEDFTAGESYYLSPITAGLITTISESFNWQNGMVKQLIGQGVPDGLELEIDAGHIVGELNDEIENIVDEKINTNNNNTVHSLIASFISGFKYADFLISSNATENYTTIWKVEELNERIGEFKVQVIIRDKTTDNLFHLQAILGFDHLDTTNKQSTQSDVLTDTTVTLTLSVNASTNFLEAALTGMPTNAKNIHFCFERCILGEDQIGIQAEGLLELTAEAELTAYANMEAEGLLELTGEVGGAADGNMEAEGLIELDGDAEIAARAYGEAEGLLELTADADLDDANASSVEDVNYGYLYNWWALQHSSSIANTGWRIATSDDWTTLRTYIGGGNYGGDLKEVGTIYWDTESAGATNLTGFNLRGNGVRPGTGAFSQLGGEAHIGLSTYIYDTYWHIIFLKDENDYISAGSSSSDFNAGRGVRLVKESTTLTDGEEGTYTGNDGNIYRTICIGTQEWLADNVKETKYRDGTAIPEETDATTWAGLTTGARCSYNNDEDNA